MIENLVKFRRAEVPKLETDFLKEIENSIRELH